MPSRVLDRKRPWQIATSGGFVWASGEVPVGADWEALLAPLTTVPRENGSQELLETARWLEHHLRAAGWEVTQHWYTAYPYEQRILGLLLLAGGLFYAMCIWRRRFGTAALVGLFLPLIVIAQVDLGVPLTWFAPFPQPNVVARWPNPDAREVLVFSAHFDTKTDLFDHVTRAPILVFSVPAAFLMFAVAAGSYVAQQAGNLSVGRLALARILGWVGAAYSVLLAAAFSGGMLLGRRSPGALDDGAACATLLRLAYQLREEPPKNVEVNLVFFSGEEVAAQGSAALLRRWKPDGQGRAVKVVNLDPWGASAALRVLGSERGFLRGNAPSPEVVALLDEAHRQIGAGPIETVPLVGLTDAWMWLQHGYPAATVFSSVPPFILPRSLHSGDDHRMRVDRPSLDFSVKFLGTVVRVLDRDTMAVPEEAALVPRSARVRAPQKNPPRHARARTREMHVFTEFGQGALVQPERPMGPAGAKESSGWLESG